MLLCPTSLFSRALLAHYRTGPVAVSVSGARDYARPPVPRFRHQRNLLGNNARLYVDLGLRGRLETSRPPHSVWCLPTSRQGPVSAVVMGVNSWRDEI
jgi:hypothetical protein